MSDAQTTTVPQKSAKEAHQENAEFAKTHGLPSVKIVGNTFPIKGLLFALGGKWDKDAQCWMVPQHTAVQAQAAANRFTKGTAEFVKAEADKAAEKAKAQEAKAAAAAEKAKAQPPKPAPAPKAAKPAMPAAGTLNNLQIRTTALADMIAGFAKDLPPAAQALMLEAEAKVREATAALG